MKNSKLNFSQIFNAKLYILGLICLVFTALAIIPTQNNYTKAYAIQNDNNVLIYSNESTQTNSNLTNENNRVYLTERLVEINFQPLKSKEVLEISLQLLDQEIYRVTKTEIEKRSENNYTWRGKIFNTDNDVILTIIDGLMTGLIYTPDQKVYKIVPIEKGVHKIVLVDQSKFPECSGSLMPIESNNETTLNRVNRPNLNEPIARFAGFPASPNIETENIPVAEDGADKISVLVLYTPNARMEARGIAQARVHAQGSIDSTNTAYANSGITTRLSLAGVEEIEISESSDYSSMLNFIRTSSSVGAMRDSSKADLVSLIVSSNSSRSLCGLAFITAPANFAFSVVNFGCAIDNLTFAHELGHNMGCNHNPENGGGGQAFPFSFGHFQVNSYRTVLATAAPNNPCGNCNRVPQFSNPDINFRGLPTGTNQRNNARTINERAEIVANFRQNDATTSPGDFSFNINPSSKTIAPGQTADFFINLNTSQDFSSKIDFTFNGLPTSAMVPAFEGSSLIPFQVVTTPDIFPRSYVINVTAMGGGITRTANFTLNVVALPGVSISVTPTAQTINAGQATTFSVAINRTSFTGTVDLTPFCNSSNCPPSITFDKTSFSTSGNVASFTLFTDNNTVAGSYEFRISAKGDGITATNSNTFTLNVNANIPKAVSLSVNPTTQTITAGQNASYNINVSRTNFSDPISVNVLCSGNCPPGVKLDKENFSISGNSETINLSTNDGTITPAGTYQFFLRSTASGITIADTAFTVIVNAVKPMIANASYTKPNLSISGTNFDSNARVIINGADSSSRITNQSSNSISLKGNKKKLNLVKGTNTLVVTNADGSVSNSFTFSFLTDLTD